MVAGAEDDVDVAVPENETAMVVMFAPPSLVLRRSQLVRVDEAHIAAGIGPDRSGLAVNDKTSKLEGSDAGACVRLLFWRYSVLR